MIIRTLLALLCFYVGNHESINMNQMYGFEGETKAKYPYYSLVAHIECSREYTL